MSDLWEGDSPRIHLIKDHFRSLKLETWNNARVSRLARAMGVTIEELCALAGLFGKPSVAAHWRHAEKDKVWPGPIALHFAQLEKFYYERVFETASPPGAPEIQTALILSNLNG